MISVTVAAQKGGEAAARCEGPVDRGLPQAAPGHDACETGLSGAARCHHREPIRLHQSRRACRSSAKSSV